MKIAALTAALLVLSGCAAPRPPAAPPPAITAAPTCLDAGECARMWVAAQQAAENLSGMRLRIVTESRIETYPPTGRRGSYTGMTAVKYPRADGVTEIRADLFCYGHLDCRELRPLGINAFNASVSSSGDPQWQRKK